MTDQRLDAEPGELADRPVEVLGVDVERDVVVVPDQVADPGQGGEAVVLAEPAAPRPRSG